MHTIQQLIDDKYHDISQIMYELIRLSDRLNLRLLKSFHKYWAKRRDDLLESLYEKITEIKRLKAELAKDKYANMIVKLSKVIGE